MKKYNRINRLIIDENRVFLTHLIDLNEVTYNDESYTELYRLEDGVMCSVRDDEPLTESDFENLYEKYTEFDEECGHEKFEFEDECGEVGAYAKAEWCNYDEHRYIHFESEHGINTSIYDFDEDTEIIEGECFIADDYICQDYPRTEHQNFFKFVSNDGKEYYIRETHPFFIDESDYVFELIDKEEFEEYDNGEE